MTIHEAAATKFNPSNDTLVERISNKRPPS